MRHCSNFKLVAKSSINQFVEMIFRGAIIFKNAYENDNFFRWLALTEIFAAAAKS
jgi:hypothetical protein